MNTKTSTWVGGTVVVALVLAVLAWFVQISPTLTQASTAAQAAQDAEARNEQLTRQIANLKKQADNLDTYRAERDSLQTKVPTTDEQSAFVRDIHAYAERSNVGVRTIVAAPATAVVPPDPADIPASAQPTPAPTASAAPSPSPSAPAPAPGTAAGSTTTTDPLLAQIPGFVALPMDITVVGSYADVMHFVTYLREGKRPFLVSAFTGGGKDASTDPADLPVDDGDLELTISGYAYSYVDPTATVPADPAEGDAKPELPKWNGKGEQPTVS